MRLDKDGNHGEDELGCARRFKGIAVSLSINEKERSFVDGRNSLRTRSVVHESTLYCDSNFRNRGSSTFGHTDHERVNEVQVRNLLRVVLFQNSSTA